MGTSQGVVHKKRCRSAGEAVWAPGRFRKAHIHPSCKFLSRPVRRRGVRSGGLWPDRAGAMHHPACGLRRILLPRTPVHKAWKEGLLVVPNLYEGCAPVLGFRIGA